jgi:hypothetical protein
LDDGPDFLVGQLIAKSDHGGARQVMLDDPKQFALCAMAPKPMVLKISRGWMEIGCNRSVSAPVFSMTVEAGAFTVIQRLAFAQPYPENPEADL